MFVQPRSAVTCLIGGSCLLQGTPGPESLAGSSAVKTSESRMGFSVAPLWTSARGSGGGSCSVAKAETEASDHRTL